MKRFYFVMLILVPGWMNAQGDSTKTAKKGISIDDDSARVTITIPKHRQDSAKKDKHRANLETFAMDLGFNLYLVNGSPNYPASLSQIEPNIGKSMDVSLHFLPLSVKLYKRYIRLKTAVTLDIMDYGFQSPVTLQKAMPTLSWVSDSVSFKKNKLQASYLQLPLILDFQTAKKRNKSFHFAFGGYAGFLVGSSLRQKTSDNDKVKTPDDFNLEKFRYGITGRIGYGWFTLYTNYNLSNFWRNDQSPAAVRPVTFGLSIIPL